MWYLLIELGPDMTERHKPTMFMGAVPLICLPCFGHPSIPVNKMN